MAERRMMSKKIIDTDKFLDMPQSTQNLYFHLLLRADDDGFIQSPKSVMRITGCKDDDLKLLIAKEFLIRFDTGVIVIKHWRIHNYLRVDRYNKSELPEVKQVQLVDKVYELTGGTTIGTTIGIPAVTEMDTQIRIDKKIYIVLQNRTIHRKKFMKSLIISISKQVNHTNIQQRKLNP